MENSVRIKPRDREAVIRSLRSGVVPSVGLQYIQVGRAKEVESFLRDIRTVADGGASFRLVVGEYGAGKTFFLALARNLAFENGLATMSADLSPEKRFHGSAGQSRRLLSELVASLSTRTKRDGNALPMILDRLAAAASEKGMPLQTLLAPLRELPGGHPFAKVVGIYAAADSEDARQNALRWLSAQYGTRTDAQRDLGVRDLLGDTDIFAALRLYAALVRAAGFGGLYVCLDELVNLYKITNATSRRANYEDLLSILNNTLQGNVHGLGVVLSGTPEFLTDTRRGLYSYEALRSRLAENTLSSQAGLTDYNSTVLRLPNLTREELYVLLKNLRRLFASADPALADRVPDEALAAYLQWCFEKIGESYFRTPRSSIKGFVDLLSLMQQYPEKTWQEILPTLSISVDREPSPLSCAAQPQAPASADAGSDLLSSFTL